MEWIGVGLVRLAPTESGLVSGSCNYIELDWFEKPLTATGLVEPD